MTRAPRLPSRSTGREETNARRFDLVGWYRLFRERESWWLLVAELAQSRRSGAAADLKINEAAPVLKSYQEGRGWTKASATDNMYPGPGGSKRD